MSLPKSDDMITNIMYARENVRSDGTTFFSFSNRRHNFEEIPERKIACMYAQMCGFCLEDIYQYKYMINSNWKYFSDILDDPEFKLKTDDEKRTHITAVFNSLNLDLDY